MRVFCPLCDSRVAEGDVDLDAGRARCRSCDELFPLPDLNPEPTLDLARPPGEQITYAESIEAGRTAITLTPSRLGALPLFLFATFWNVVAMVVSIAALHSSKSLWEIFPFPFPQIVVGIALAWLALVRVLNRFEITLDAGRFIVRQAPLPSRGADLAVDEIDGFDVYESRRKGRGVTWGARVLTKDDRVQRLPLSIDTREEAAFVVARLNAALAAVRMPTGYRDEPSRFRAPPPSPTPPSASDPAEEALPPESRRGTLAR